MAQLGKIFDNDTATLAAYTLARAQFDEVARHDLGDPLPEDQALAMQLQLMRWQRDRFGDQSDERMALGIIEEQTETFDAEDPDQAEDALDGLGDVIVYAGQLALANRLAIGPIIDLARLFTRRGDIRLIRSSGVLAQVVLKGAQKIRGMADRELYRIRLVGALAMAIGHAIDHVEILHPEVSPVLPVKVYAIVGSEVLQRAQGHDAIPSKVQPEASVRITVTQVHVDDPERFADGLRKTFETDEHGQARALPRKPFDAEAAGLAVMRECDKIDALDSQAERMAHAQAVHEQALAETQPFDLSDQGSKPAE